MASGAVNAARKILAGLCSAEPAVAIAAGLGQYVIESPGHASREILLSRGR